MQIQNIFLQRRFDREVRFQDIRSFKSDNRVMILRFYSHNVSAFINGKGFKVSLAFHPYIFKYMGTYKEFRLTLLFINLHVVYN